MARLAALLPLALAAFLRAQDTGLVEGRLTNRAGPSAIVGIPVTLTEVDSKAEYKSSTDLAGAFRFSDLPRGDYNLKYEADEFLDLPSYHPARGIIKVDPGRSPIRLDLGLIPKGRLKGRVIDSEGRAVASARVELSAMYEESRLVELTNAAGTFEFGSLTPGRYSLMAESTAANSSVPDERRAWAPTYFPDRLELAEAEAIVVRGGVQLSDYEIRLRSVTVHKVRGQVIGLDGKPMPGVAVQAVAGHAGALAEQRSVTTDAAEFEMELRAGRWFLTSEPEGDRSIYGATAVTVTRSDLNDVRVRLQRRFTVTGVVEGTPPLPLVYLRAVGGPARPMVTGRFEKDGTIRIPNMAPGRYQVVVRFTRRPEYLESISFGEQDALGREIDLFDGAPPFRVVFASGVSGVRGTVAGGRSAVVVLLPQEEWLLSDVLLGIAGSDRSGHFDLTGVRPGNYYAFAFDRVGAWGSLVDAAFVKTLLPHAARVQVQKGETASLELKLTPWPE